MYYLHPSILSLRAAVNISTYCHSLSADDCAGLAGGGGGGGGGGGVGGGGGGGGILNLHKWDC